MRRLKTISNSTSQSSLGNFEARIRAISPAYLVSSFLPGAEVLLAYAHLHESGVLASFEAVVVGGRRLVCVRIVVQAREAVPAEAPVADQIVVENVPEAFSG